jgi:acetyltransferase-like isoleucine patch superfamily enzyme
MNQAADDRTKGEIKPAEMPLGNMVLYFFLSSWLSIIPASTVAYFWIRWSIDVFSAVPGLALLSITACLVSAYIVLILGTWLVSKAGVAFVCKGKPVPDGKFVNTFSDPELRKFTMRHVAKKFSMWFFQHHVPHWLHRLYIRSFIKMGKHVETPEWVAMENAEIGDNTVFARQTVFSSHVIDGKILTVKTVKIGKNCIVDAEDETKRVCIMPGSLVEDNVIIKPGTYISKDTVLKAGGIYQGDIVVERIGNISDMSPDEIESYRKAVRKKRVMKSAMLTDWSSFTSPWPRLIYKAADILGYANALAFLAIFWVWVFPALVSSLGIIGHAINIALFPALLFAAYGFYVFVPLPIIAKCVHHYDKVVPKLADDPAASIEIDDPAIIETWRKCKWLKWQAVDRVNQSLFLDTSMLIYQRIGKNEVAFKTVLYNAKLDTDYIAVGDNTLLSFGCHIYAYKLVNHEGKTRLVLKRTIIGKNCILGSAIIYAGARIGDDVVLGFHTVVPEDAILESGKTYAGNPAVEFTQFLELRKKLKGSTRSQG